MPFAMALAGLALLTSVATALIWLAMLVAIAYGYVRFNSKHNEHEEYDDHLDQAKYHEGLGNYIKLVEEKLIDNRKPHKSEPAPESKIDE